MWCWGSIKRCSPTTHAAGLGLVVLSGAWFKVGWYAYSPRLTAAAGLSTLDPVLVTASPDLLSEAVSEVALSLEAAADAGGWDAPPVLYEIRMDPPSEVAEVLASMGLDPESAPPDLWPEMLESSPGFGQILSARPLGLDLNSDDLASSLVGVRLDPEAVGAAVIAEGWAYGPDTMAAIASKGADPPFSPSEDPQRVELRQAYLLLRDGSGSSVLRYRGSEPSASTFSADSELSYEGRLVDALCRIVGRPSPPPELDLYSVAAAAFLLVSSDRAADSRLQRADRTVGELAASALGLDRALVLASSSGVSDWESARLEALEAFSQLTSVLSSAPRHGFSAPAGAPSPGTLLEMVAESSVFLDWADEGVLSRRFADLPSFEEASSRLSTLVSDGLIRRQQAKELLEDGLRVKASGWLPSERLRWVPGSGG